MSSDRTDGQSNGWPRGAKERIQRQWPALSDEELDSTEGRADALVALLELKLGYAPENARADVSELLAAGDEPDVTWDREAVETTTDRPSGGDFIQLRGLRIHYLDWGNPDRRPMLLVHGLGGVASEWQRVAAHFESRYHVIAVDLRGHGDSDRSPAGEYGPEVLRDDLERFITELGLEDAVLVGHGIGAQLALGAAESLRDRIGLVVIDPGEPGLDAELDGGGSFPSSEEYVERLKGRLPATPEWALYSMAGERLRESPGGVSMKYDPASEHGWAAAQPRPAVGALRPPLLVVHGAEPGPTGERLLAMLREHVPDARFEKLEGAGAYTFFDAEDRFLEVVDQFLDSPLGDPSAASRESGAKRAT